MDYLGPLLQGPWVFQGTRRKLYSELSNWNENSGRKRICVLREDIMAALVVCPSHRITVLIGLCCSSWQWRGVIQWEITIKKPIHFWKNTQPLRYSWWQMQDDLIQRVPDFLFCFMSSVCFCLSSVSMSCLDDSFIYQSITCKMKAKPLIAFWQNLLITWLWLFLN